jgi:hypothetical protein
MSTDSDERRAKSEEVYHLEEVESGKQALSKTSGRDERTCLHGGDENRDPRIRDHGREEQLQRKEPSIRLSAKTGGNGLAFHKVVDMLKSTRIRRNLKKWAAVGARPTIQLWPKKQHQCLPQCRFSSGQEDDTHYTMHDTTVVGKIRSGTMSCVSSGPRQLCPCAHVKLKRRHVRERREKRTTRKASRTHSLALEGTGS